MERLVLEHHLRLVNAWGHPSLGLLLSHAYFAGECYSVEQIADQLQVTKQTIYNHLKRLTNIDRVIKRSAGRNAIYCATETWAVITREICLASAKDVLNWQKG